MPNTHVRNFDRVQFERVRKVSDARFNVELDKLEDAYYGTPQFRGEVFTGRTEDGWKHDVSHSVTIGGQLFDKLATTVLSKAQFDDIHGVIHHLLVIERVVENGRQLLPDRYPTDKINPEELDEFEVPTGRREDEVKQEQVNAIKLKGIDLTI